MQPKIDENSSNYFSKIRKIHEKADFLQIPELAQSFPSRGLYTCNSGKDEFYPSTHNQLGESDPTGSFST
ncbi:hypothetical protein ACL7TT_08085 [Microbulbifer sp. 2304DJ12-6]|uniref:hypothetical protein n=1 Tax=Microbulbifer sp. 2304DJ12-6 TaxID=3233340 RepID=UPI0039B01B80